MPKRLNGQPPYRATRGGLSDGRIVQIDHRGDTAYGAYIGIEISRSYWDAVRIPLTVEDADKLIALIQKACSKALVDRELGDGS